MFSLLWYLIACCSTKAISPKIETNIFSVHINVSYVNLVRVLEKDKISNSELTASQLNNPFQSEQEIISGLYNIF